MAEVPNFIPFIAYLSRQQGHIHFFMVYFRFVIYLPWHGKAQMGQREKNGAYLMRLSEEMLNITRFRLFTLKPVLTSTADGLVNQYICNPMEIKHLFS